MEVSSLPQGQGFSLSASRRALSTLGDDRLIEQIRRGNSVAFEVVYDRYQAPLLSFCRHMLGSREEAEDALQQTFVSAHRDLLASRKPIRLRAWLYTIARNRSLSMLRARHEEPDEAIEPSTAGLSEQVQRRDDLRALVGDLGELPEEQRAALLVAEVQDLAHAEIAAVIGCEASKVKSLIFQARSGLIERREARETPCEDIREQLSTLTGGALRRGHLRRHLKACPGCRAFREEVKEQRRRLAAILPVIPGAGLKQGVLGAIGIGGGTAGGGGLAAGGAAIGGAAAGDAGGSALGGVLATGGALKLGVTAIVVGTVAVGGAILAGDDNAATAGEDGGSGAQSAPGELSGGGAEGGATPRGRGGVLGESEEGGGAGAVSGDGDRSDSLGGDSTHGSSSGGGLGDGTGGGGGSGLSSDSAGGGGLGNGSGGGPGSPGGGGLGNGSGGSGGSVGGYGQASAPALPDLGGGGDGGKDKDKDKADNGNHTGHQQGQGHQEHGNGQGNGHDNHDHDRPLVPTSP